MIPHDLRISVRSLFRAPGFALTSILTVALAVGMATAVFSVVNAVLLRPLPYKEAGRLAVIWTVWPNEPRGPVAFDDFEDWRRDSSTLESAAMYTAFYKPIVSGAGSATAERLPALLVSHQYFDVMRVKPRLGRFFTPEEDRNGRDNIVVLSDGLWRGMFQSDPGVVGRTILLNSVPHLIVGVAGPDLLPLPPSMADEPSQLYRPIGEPFGPGSRDGRHLETLVRLKPGATIALAQAELDARSRRMEREHPKEDARINARILTLRDDMIRNVRTGLVSLQAAVLMLMLIACANVANLLLARSSARRGEMALREALGAGTARLARLLLAEGLVLGLAGGAAGLALAWWGTAGLTQIAASVLPDAGSIGVDPRVLLFSLAASLAASVLFAMAPLFRVRARDLAGTLKQSTRVAGDHRNTLRACLAGGQIALAMMLLIATGLLGKSFLRLAGVDPGFDPRGVLTATVSLPRLRYSTPAAAVQFYERALAGLRAVPGAAETTAVSVLPLSANFDRTGFAIPGKQFDSGVPSPDRYIVGGDYFRAMRIAVRQGRVFDERDSADRPPVCVISETAARLWFPGESPLGRTVRAGGIANFDTSPFREIVGVVGDIAQYGLGLPATPQIYMPHAQFPVRQMTLLARGVSDPASLRRVVAGIDSEQPVYNVRTMDSVVANTIAARRVGVWMVALFAFSALALAAVGIYGVVSYSVARRTAEFGIRVALGASPGDVVRQAVRDSLGMTAAGLAAGTAASLAVSRAITGFLFGVSATDPATFVVLPVFLALVALIASYVPARRAARVDPANALRCE
jgi:putative ABC transport system permease protein